MFIKRKENTEQPHINLGMFKLRIPFIHHKFTFPEVIQGIILVAVALGAIPILQETLGVSFELALTIVALNGFIYLLHPAFGDPVFPGWITPALPLVLAYAATFGEGTDRVQAIIALQLCMAALFFFMGITGVADKLVNIVPMSLRSGIILGAGVSAIHGVINAEGRMKGIETTVLIGAAICFLVLFSFRFARAKSNSNILAVIAKYGMVPGLVAAAIIGPMVGEIAIPTMEYGFVQFKFAEVIQECSVFGSIPMPGIEYFIKALPLAITTYIIAFSNFVVAEAVIKDAGHVREDEVIEYNANRANIIVGIRNLIMGLIAPFAPLCGPLWAAGTISVFERYKNGRKEMDSIYDGMSAFILSMAVAAIFLPFISLLKPVLPAALSLTMLIQGFACIYIALEMVQTKEERGIAGIMAVFLAFRSPTWGLAVGIVMFLIIGQKHVVAKTKEKLKEVAA